MNILKSRGFQIGTGLVIIGFAVCLLLLTTDQNDPDYAPPRFVIASLLAGYLVVAGIATILYSAVSSCVGAAKCLAVGVGIGVFGIFKLFAFHMESFEVWRISRTETITFDLAAAVALALGGALMLKSRAPQRQEVSSA